MILIFLEMNSLFHVAYSIAKVINKRPAYTCSF